MKGSARVDSVDERLTDILHIARRQRKLLAQGDLDALAEMQQRRQQLMAGIQSLDNASQDTCRVRSEIVRLDKEMGALLLAELAEINNKLKTSTTLRKLLRSRSSASERPSRHLSRHA